MAAVDLCTFNHGLGIYIRILSLAGAREKIIEWNENENCICIIYSLYLSECQFHSINFNGLWVWCLTPLSIIFHFYWSRKPPMNSEKIRLQIGSFNDFLLYILAKRSKYMISSYSYSIMLFLMKFSHFCVIMSICR